MSYLKEEINLKDKRHLLSIIGTLIIFLSIPFTVTLVQQSREPTSRAATTPNDPYFQAGYQWALTKIHAPEAWDITTGSRSVIVALLGSGVGTTTPNEDLGSNSNLIPGYNVLKPGTPTYDSIGSGSMEAGVIGASTNNGVGIAGINWQVGLMPVVVCDFPCSDLNDYGYTATGIRWAVDHGASVLFVHQGLRASTALESAVNYAIGKGAIVVAPLALVDNPARYPAAYPGVVAVGNTDQNDMISPYSGSGPELDITAPGEVIMSTGHVPYYYPVATTNTLAAAHVAGVLGLLLSKGVSPTAAVNALYQGAKDLGTAGWDSTYGWGRLDACGALNKAGFACVAPPPPPPPTLSVVLSGRVLSSQTFSSAGVSGTAPLNGVDIQASVGGTAIGRITYRFDCTNDGTYESNLTTDSNPEQINDLCSYQTAGNYLAAVRVERAGVFATDTLPINVTGGGDTLPPSVTITNPAGGQTVSGTVNVGADAVDR